MEEEVRDEGQEPGTGGKDDSITADDQKPLPDLPAPEPLKSNRVSCILGPEIYAKVFDEVKQRKLTGKPNASISGVLIDALEAFFNQRASPPLTST